VAPGKRKFFEGSDDAGGDRDRRGIRDSVKGAATGQRCPDKATRKGAASGNARHGAAGAGDEAKVGTVPGDAIAGLDQTLGAPSVARLLGKEECKAGVVGVDDTHARRKGDPETGAFGGKAEFGVANPAEALIEGYLLEYAPPGDEVTCVTFRGVSRRKTPEVSAVAPLNDAGHLPAPRAE
jgi:hypothetical protein